MNVPVPSLTFDHSARSKYVTCHKPFEVNQMVQYCKLFPYFDEESKASEVHDTSLDDTSQACYKSVMAVHHSKHCCQGATGMKKNDIGSIKNFRALALDLPTSM